MVAPRRLLPLALAALAPRGALAFCERGGAHRTWAWYADPWAWWDVPRQCQEDGRSLFKRGARLTGPVLVSLGPHIEGEFLPRHFDAFPIADLLGAPAFSLQPALALEDLHALLGTGTGTFQAEAADGRLRLRASLPGYGQGLRQAGDEEQEPALSVQVVGRALVVAGHTFDGQTVSSFQRSFSIPEGADVHSVSVTYSNADGALVVDIPGEAGPSALLPDRGGWHTRVTFAGPPARGWAPSLRGRAASPMEELLGLVRRAADFSESLAAPATSTGAAVAGAAAVTATVPWEEAALLFRSEQPAPAPAAAAPPAVRVQPTGALPFWRLAAPAGADAGEAVEVVVPQGVDLGLPEGRKAPIYNATEAGHQAIGAVELPVSVGSDDCAWAEPTGNQERVLQCKLGKDAVTRVPIKLADEL